MLAVMENSCWEPLYFVNAQEIEERVAFGIESCQIHKHQNDDGRDYAVNAYGNDVVD